MNIVLFALDTLRADHLGCYGYPRDTSPRIDALAREGMLFENAMTNTAHTGPTFTTMYTGQYPFTHGIVTTLWGHPNEHDQLLDDTTPTLPEVMRANGYLTAAFDNLMIWPSHPSHFARGYDYYVHTLNPGNFFCAAVLAEQINARLLPWIEAHAREHFFLFIHYWDPHQPYNQPEPYRAIHKGKPGFGEETTPDGRTYVPLWGETPRLTPKSRERIDLYDGEITYNDFHIGQVLDTLKRLGIYEQTAIVLTSDHGEDMEEHHAPFEHREPYETTVHVPLIVKPSSDWPASAPSRVSSVVGHIDLMPTILDLAKTEPPAGMDGQSWLPLLGNPSKPLREELFITGGALKQNGRWRAPELAVRTQTMKHIRRARVWNEPTHINRELITLCKPPKAGVPGVDRTELSPMDMVAYFNSLPSEELYDLIQDPCETNNLVTARPADAARLRAALDRHIATNPERFQAAR